MEGDRGDGLDISDGMNVGLGSTPLDKDGESDRGDDPAASALDSMGYSVDGRTAVDRPNDDPANSGTRWLRTVRELVPLFLVLVVLVLLVALWVV